MIELLKSEILLKIWMITSGFIYIVKEAMEGLEL